MPRKVLILLSSIAIALSCLSCSQLGQLSPPAQGWKRIRWDAGYGSWAFGGMGVAYSIDMPENYDFSTKLGNAWITSPDSTDDLISLGFWTKQMDTSMQVRGPDGLTHMVKVTQGDFETFKDTYNQSKQQYPDRFGPIKVISEQNVIINGLPFRRIDYGVEESLESENTNKAPVKKRLLKGFHLRSENIWVRVDPLEPKQLAVCEEIVQSLRR